MEKILKNDNLKTFTYTCDGFFLLGLLLVLFPNFGKSRIPSFLYPFFCFDGMLSVYPFAIFSVMVIIWLFLKKVFDCTVLLEMHSKVYIIAA